MAKIRTAEKCDLGGGAGWWWWGGGCDDAQRKVAESGGHHDASLLTLTEIEVFCVSFALSL